MNKSNEWDLRQSVASSTLRKQVRNIKLQEVKRQQDWTPQHVRSLEPPEDEEAEEDAADDGRLANYRLEDVKRATLYEDTTLKHGAGTVNSALADQSRHSGSVILNYNEFKLLGGPIVVPKTLNGEQSTLSIGQRDDDDA